MACSRMSTMHHTADEAKKAAEQWEGPAIVPVTG